MTHSQRQAPCSRVSSSQGTPIHTASQWLTARLGEGCCHPPAVWLISGHLCRPSPLWAPWGMNEASLQPLGNPISPSAHSCFSRSLRSVCRSYFSASLLHVNLCLRICLQGFLPNKPHRSFPSTCTRGPVPQVQSVKHVSPLYLSLGIIPGQISSLFDIFEFLNIQGNQQSFLGFPYTHHFMLQLIFAVYLSS